MEEEIKYEETNNAAWDDWDEWAFGDEVDVTIPELTHNIWPRTNQGSREKTKSACTIYWALNQLIRLFALDLTSKESNDLGEEVVDYCAKNHWYIPWYGRSTPTAINAVCKRWNEIWYKRFNKDKVLYIRKDWQDSKIKEALSKWHLIGFTKSLDFGEDRKKWLVYKDSYPAAGWHRTNWQSTKTTIPTGWASEPTADCGVYDSYYGGYNQYLIRDRSKYMNKGMNTSWYLILPVSNMINQTVEEVKTDIAETKAMNYVLWALSTTWESVPAKYQEKFAALAKEIREDYKDARKLENEPNKKGAEASTDALSYLWKIVDEETQKKFAQIASELRAKFNFK